MNILKKENGDIKIWIIFTVGIAIIFLFVLFFNYLLSKITGLDFPDNAGSFGDQFGVLNTTFAGLAFMGVVCALLQQQNQIRKQDDQIRKQDIEVKNENINFEKKNFNEHFYRLFNHTSSLASQIKIKKDGGYFEQEEKEIQETQGIEAFEYIYNYFNSFNNVLNIYADHFMKNDQEYENFIINISLLNICKKSFGEVSSWTYLIDKMLRTISDNKYLSKEEQKDYIEMVFFSLSKYQCQIMKFVEYFLSLDNFYNLEAKYFLSENTSKHIFAEDIDWELWNIVFKSPSRKVQERLDNLMMQRKKRNLNTDEYIAPN